jgi:hypothetical protein
MRGSDGRTLVAINLQAATSARSPGSDRADAETAGLEEPPPATQPADPAPGTSEPVAADERVPAVPPISADVERAVEKMAPAPGVEVPAPMASPAVSPGVNRGTAVDALVPAQSRPSDKPAVAHSASSTSKRRGPEPGAIDRFCQADRALFSDITNIKETKNLTAQEVARELGNLGKVKGRGSLESSMLRLARRYRKEVERKEDDLN